MSARVHARGEGLEAGAGLPEEASTAATATARDLLSPRAEFRDSVTSAGVVVRRLG